MRRYIKKHAVSLSMIALVFLISFSVNGVDMFKDAGLAAEAVNTILTGNTGEQSGNLYEDAPGISASSAIVIDAESGDVLYEKNADEKAYPASTTKIMTAMLAIEMLEKLDSPAEQKVKVPDEAVGVEGSSIYLAYDEEVRITDLLYGMMLRSGNDAATAVAAVMGGSVEAFVENMNLRARELGCTGTNFVNPSGLFDDNHYTTVRDMAVISREAMTNELFREIAGAEEYTAERAPDMYNYFYNKNKTVHQYEGGNGIKIGYTKASGRTLVASAKRNGTELICVVMNAPDWFNDAYRLMDYCFERN